MQTRTTQTRTTDPTRYQSPGSGSGAAARRLSQPCTQHGRLGASADLELRQQARHVVLDRLLADVEQDTDLAIRVTVDDQLENAPLLRRQHGELPVDGVRMA